MFPTSGSAEIIINKKIRGLLIQTLNARFYNLYTSLVHINYNIASILLRFFSRAL